MLSLLIFHQRLSGIKLSLTSFLLIVSVIFSLSMNTLNADLDGVQPKEELTPIISQLVPSGFPVSRLNVTDENADENV